MQRPQDQFWHTLALALGGRTIAEWKEVMSSDEVTAWMAFYHISPFGDYRGDIQAAIVANIIANANAPKGKKYQVKDFLPTFRSPYVKKPDMTGQEIQDFFKRLAQQQGTS